MAMTSQRRGGAAAPYQSRTGGVQPVYEDLKPASEWLEDDDSYNLIIQVPGFMREQLKVSTEDEKTIRVRGERLVAGNKWSRFQEDFQIPDNTELTSVRAKYDSGILTITVPRKNIAGKTLATKKEENKASQETLTPRQKAQDRVLPPKTTGMTTLREPEVDRQGRDKVTPTDDKTLEPAPGIWKTSGDQRTKIGRLEDEQKSYIEKEKRPEMKEKHAAPENTVDKAVENIVDGKSVELPRIQRTSGDHPSTRTGRQEDEQKSYTEKKGSQENKEKHVDNVGKGKEITEDHKKIKSEKGNQIDKSSEADDSPESDHGAFKMELNKYKKKAMKVSHELNEERQLMVNMGAALLVIVAISAYVSYNYASQNAK
ncbi:inactive protein RESTRICTED TEV MOVEMENT 2 [Abeliophyllum distichum]|uniref:Inactive protein RESTRICTED TEV MOVEMENT 2 n=1 Tax=Abeliophyllum distichum TaxID=126358 RepID=A0ABD1PAY0_9LAMI